MIALTSKLYFDLDVFVARPIKKQLLTSGVKLELVIREASRRFDGAFGEKL